MLRISRWWESPNTPASIVSSPEQWVRLRLVRPGRARSAGPSEVTRRPLRSRDWRRGRDERPGTVESWVEARRRLSRRGRPESDSASRVWRGLWLRSRCCNCDWPRGKLTSETRLWLRSRLSRLEGSKGMTSMRLWERPTLVRLSRLRRPVTSLMLLWWSSRLASLGAASHWRPVTELSLLWLRSRVSRLSRPRRSGTEARMLWDRTSEVSRELWTQVDSWNDDSTRQASSYFQV